MISTQNLPNSLDLKAVLQGCLVGKKSYQEALYQNYAPVMFAICLRYASDYHTAEDILQEGFIKVFSKLHKFRGEGSFEGWMKRIFINTSIEYFRKASNQRFKKIEEDYQVAIEPSVIQQLEKDDLIQMIQKLPKGYRNVFNLYVIDGYNHNEIAEMLNISSGTSKSQLARARLALKKQILLINKNEAQ